MIPVYVINGFLESGKTEFIKYTIQQPYFQTKGRTLLIMCEEGEVEIESDILKKTRTVLVNIENEEDFNPEKLSEYEETFRPERIIIEYNGMWNFKNMMLPRNWEAEQQITTIDASTFPAYYTNMRSLLAEMLRNSEMIIFNRCDGIEDLSSYKRNVRAVNQNAEIIFEDSNGEVSQIMEDDLPYDLSQDRLVLDNEGYGIWYLDMFEHPSRYDGKTLVFKAMVLRPESFPEDYFVPGRMVMTCCADDITFMGFACEYEGAKELENREWVEVVCTTDRGYWPDYNGEGPILRAVSVTKTTPPEETVIDFNSF